MAGKGEWYILFSIAPVSDIGISRLIFRQKNAWIRITNEFNYTAIERRTPEQLKQKYETLKKEARREAANMVLNPVETEVDVPSKEKSNPLYIKIRQMMELSAEESPTMQFTESMGKCGSVYL